MHPLRLLEMKRKQHPLHGSVLANREDLQPYQLQRWLIHLALCLRLFLEFLQLDQR